MDLGFLTLIDRVKGIDYPTLWRILLLGFTRFVPIVALAPFLGAKIIPNSARVGLAITLTLVFLPTMLLPMQGVPMPHITFIAYAFKELFIGLVLGYLSSAPFFAAQAAGIFIDFMRGSSQMMAQDPALQAQASPIGIVLNYYLIVMFYTLNGPLMFFDAVQLSFELFPVDAYLNPVAFNLKAPLWNLLIHISGNIFAMAIQLAAPALLAILMAEVFLGIANRLAPQVQIAFLGMPLKSLLGLTLLWAGWYAFGDQMGTMSMEWVNLIKNTLRGTKLLVV